MCKKPAQHPGGFSHHSAPTSLHRPVGASAGARAWTAVTLRLLLVLLQVAPCDSQEGTPQRAPAGRRLCRAASHRGTSTRTGPVGCPSAAWPACGTPKAAGLWVRGAERGNVHWLQPEAAGPSQLFVKHQALFVMAPIKSHPLASPGAPEAGAERQMNQP